MLEVRQNTDHEPIDPEMILRGKIEDLKQVLHADRVQIFKTATEMARFGEAVEKIHLELKTILELIGEQYDEANQLQWAIAEHDASYAKRLNDYTAHSKEESDRLLDKIIASA